MAEGPKQGRKSALLIGINKYDSSHLPDLRGALKDVAPTEKFLTKVAGITASDKQSKAPTHITKVAPFDWTGYSFSLQSR
ncbi:hypothetical protein MKX08_008039 [Trichoderma sp. CBMAI-0020]|nr:hypothetical protein MKX08_008039 [Trichoderma sp. CBMAI-0020]WOD45579.1 hypothetical protein [Trichoderma atroviride]